MLAYDLESGSMVISKPVNPTTRIRGYVVGTGGYVGKKACTTWLPARLHRVVEKACLQQLMTTTHRLSDPDSCSC